MRYRKWLRGLFMHKAIVLMYHRVADLDEDPWQLAVRPELFEQQLQLLKKKFNVIPVIELVKQLQKGAVRSDCICITFDDGYCDNYINARPLLEKYGCPATFFIATNYIDHHRPFWWDELQYLILDTPVLPPVFSLSINGEPLHVDLHGETILTASSKQCQEQWVAPDNPPTERCALYLLLWQKVKPLPDKLVQDALDRIRSWASSSAGINAINLPLTRRQLRDMAKNRLLDIGLHSVTHPSLSVHSREVQSKEIVHNAYALESMCGRYKSLITYPYGDYNDTTIEVVKKERLEAAFTTAEKIVTKRSDRYCLGRFHVKNWNGPAFEKQVTGWIKSI